MHLRILPDHQKLFSFFQRDNFYCLERLKTCFDSFSQTSIPPETFFQKRYFLLSGMVKNVFLCICAYFPITRNFFSEKIFFTVWSGFYAFPHTSRPPETFSRKDIFDRQEWLKTCFDAFSHTSRPPETFCQQRYF
jgi:hypothetical protein